MQSRDTSTITTFVLGFGRFVQHINLSAVLCYARSDRIHAVLRNALNHFWETRRDILSGQTWIYPIVYDYDYGIY